MFLLKITIWIIAYTAGVARLSMAFLILKREKRRVDFWKVAFLLTLLSVIISLSNQEVVLALNNENIYIFGYISSYGAALIIMTLPVYIHSELTKTDKRSLKDNLFIWLSLFLCMMLTAGFIINIQKLNDIIFGSVIIVMSGSIIYSNLLVTLKNRSKKDSSRVIRILSTSVILLVPLMIWIDFINNQIAGYIILPLMYFNINVLMILSEIDDLINIPNKEKVSKGKMTVSGLTKREQEVTGLLLEGLTYQQTADHLCISIQTVKTHANHIYTKTDTNNKIELLNKLKG